MIRLTAPDGSSVAIDGRQVLRVRRTVSGEQRGDGAQTRIDWVQMQLVKEPPAEVAEAIRKELSSFVFLTSRDGSRIWFDAARATGPLSLTPSQADGVVRSSLRLMGYRQYVIETPDEVRALLAANDGNALP